MPKREREGTIKEDQHPTKTQQCPKFLTYHITYMKQGNECEI